MLDTLPPVTFDAALGLAILRTPHTRYVVRIGSDGSPRHLYWGRPLDDAVLARLPEPASPAASSFEADAAADELAPQSGARFGPAGLQVRFGDGTRGVQWRFAGATVDGGELRLRLDDRRRPLRAELCYRVRPDSDVVERWTELTHTAPEAATDSEPGSEPGSASVSVSGSVSGSGSGSGRDTGPALPVTVERLDSASWTAPALADYRLSHLVGGWNSEFQLRGDRLPVAETVLTSRRGLTGHHANPWLALDDGTATEERGEVWSTALAWSGSWRVTVHRDPVGRTTWTGGFGHEGLGWTLRPGETLRTPVYAGLYTPDGFGAASRGWHAYVRRHVLPEPGRDRPVLYNSWEATGFDVDQDGQMRLARLAAGLGAELFVLDDGWFGARRDDGAGLGDWTPRPEAFPGGLGPLADEVHRLGMDFGLWVEPEMVNRDSELYRAHPDWVLHSPELDATELRNQLVLNFARPEVADWAWRTLDGLVRENRVDWLKWDANRAFTEAGWAGHPDPDRLWIDHTRAVYRIMDRLRAAHPGLRIEACAGGGGRADLGILARTDQVWVSDNTDPVDRIGIQDGFSRLYPAQAMASWVTDSPNTTTGRRTPLRFRFHVAMAGALGIGGNLTEWTEEELAEAARFVAQYKSVRPLVQHGIQHRLGPAGPVGAAIAASAVTAVHYAAPDGGDHVVLAWRPTTRYGHAAAPVRLPALDPAAHYLDPDLDEVHSGAVLVHRGLDLRLPAGDHASRLIRLRRVTPS
ncbi:alpha-galactosidase [Streptomyces showdoensis]|uniref:Alpha-galactosidase n=1 Tax=Streptomyces showdoensis TaxID=68268 RepID=A0A2P2GNW0_STREW|nr:alpha-galactosidase [Streptomyces showdoensis]KKZ73188.1 alpha-galactosidase [Streptomyces showdoensis]